MDFENERQNRLAEVRESLFLSEGETLEARFGPETIGSHELLDRAYVFLSQWETFITEHPATLLDSERYRQAQEIAAAMAAFYQCVGRGQIG